jgi:thymidylate synthase
LIDLVYESSGIPSRSESILVFSQYQKKAILCTQLCPASSPEGSTNKSTKQKAPKKMPAMVEHDMPLSKKLFGSFTKRSEESDLTKEEKQAIKKAKKEQKKLAKEQSSKKDYGGPCSTDGESDNESAGSFKKIFGFEKKKPRAEYQAEIDDLKIQLANTQAELERARTKVNRYQQWARQAPLN